jgi:hypothetical protein
VSAVRLGSGSNRNCANIADARPISLPRLAWTPNSSAFLFVCRGWRQAMIFTILIIMVVVAVVLYMFRGRFGF